MARDARDRRLRPADLRGPGLSRRADPRTSSGNERLCGLERKAVMGMSTRPGILRVATREVNWMWRDKVALILMIVIPLVAFSLLAATFSNAVIRDLGVDIVDQDRSQTSMTYVQAINAAPGVSVTGRSVDLTGAMHAIRSGGAIASVYIPRNFERDLTSGKRPQIVIFHNKQYF